ncbi:MAG: hypothetical protein AABY07_05960 [Nanoarchaeota archaeon]
MIDQTKILLCHDGMRPWHYRFHIRDTSIGKIGVWLGSFDWDKRKEFNNKTTEYNDLASSGRSWKYMESEKYYQFNVSPAEHSTDCSEWGYLGIAVLPDLWAQFDCPWEFWRHLVHVHPYNIVAGEENIKNVLIPIWENVIEQKDYSLIKLLEEHILQENYLSQEIDLLHETSWGKCNTKVSIKYYNSLREMMPQYE